MPLRVVLSVPAFFVRLKKPHKKELHFHHSRKRPLRFLTPARFLLLQGFQNLVGVLFIRKLYHYNYKVLKTLQERPKFYISLYHLYGFKIFLISSKSISLPCFHIHIINTIIWQLYFRQFCFIRNNRFLHFYIIKQRIQIFSFCFFKCRTF